MSPPDPASASAQVRRRNRRILSALFGGLGLIALLIAVPAILLELRARSLGDELVSEVRELHAAKPKRPSHVDSPLPGSFADGLEPMVDELIALQASEAELDVETKEACAAVREGTRPFSELPKPCAEALARGRELLERTRALTRFERAGLPVELGALGHPDHPWQQKGLVSLQHVTRLGALQMRRDLEAGRADEATDLCVDLLALSRDIGSGGGLLAQMVGVATAGIAFQPCAASLDSASVEKKRSALVALRRIRAGIARPSERMREERAAMSLLGTGAVVPSSHLEALPEGARALTRESAKHAREVPVAGPLLMRDAWRQWWPLVAEIGEAMDLEPSQRTVRLQALNEKASASWNPIVRIAMPDHGRFGQRDDQRLAQHDLLVALLLHDLARTESGTWSGETPPLYPDPQQTPRFLFEVIASAEGDALRLAVRDERFPELTVTVRPE